MQQRNSEESLAWYVFAVLAGIIVIIYYFVLIFTLCDETTQKEIQLKKKAIASKVKKVERSLSQTAAR
jgi:phosphotransferase system  glucose/maltose/N-acetylglucosamine-specific IIC component